MNRASPVDLRRALEIAHDLVKSGIDFVPVPVLNTDDKLILARDVQMRLNQIENEREVNNERSAP